MIKNFNTNVLYLKNVKDPLPRSLTPEIWQEETNSPRIHDLTEKFQTTKDKSYKQNLSSILWQNSGFDPHLYSGTSQKYQGQTGEFNKTDFCHLNGKIQLDLDHLRDSPRRVLDGIIERLRTLTNDRDSHDIPNSDVAYDPFSSTPPTDATAEQLLAYAGLLLAYISPSGEGLKFVFKVRPYWGNIWQNQKKMAELLGVEATLDKSCKNATRSAFSPTAENILYQSPELFEFEDKDWAAEWEDHYRSGHVKYLHHKLWFDENDKLQSEDIYTNSEDYEKAAVDNTVTDQISSDDDVILDEGDNTQLQLTFKGIPYSTIIDEYWRRQLGHVPVVGERNVELSKLAVQLRVICDNDKNLLLKVLPSLGLPRSEMQSIVNSATKESVKGYSKLLKSILADLGVSTAAADAGTETTPPDLPQKLPKLVKLLLSNTPEIYKPAVANAIFPALAAHVHSSVCFEYIDHEMYEAALSDITMGETGAGKSCVNKPIAHIMADIRERDKVNLQREKAWRDDCNGKDKKLPRPNGLVIQECVSDMTPPTITLRLSQNEGWPIYLGLNELTLLENLKGQSGRQHHELILASFDRSLWGQMRVGAESVNDVVKAAVIINASTTLKKGREFFRTCSTDGEISRLTFALVPEQEIGADIPVFGKYTDKFDQQLKPFIDNLVAARGEIKCPQANTLIRKLMREVKDIAIERGDRTYDNLSRRALVIAWLKALVLYIANGYHWEKAIEDFTRWSLHYDLWCKMTFFSYDIEKTNSGADAKIGSRGPRSLLPLLPASFNLNDAKRMRQTQGLDISDALTKNMLKTWIKRGYIEKLTDCSYQKCG